MALCKAYLWLHGAPLSVKHGPVIARGSCLRKALLGAEGSSAGVRGWAELPSPPVRPSEVQHMATSTPGCWVAAQLGLQHTRGLLHPRFPGNNVITTRRQRINATEETGLLIANYIPCASASLCQCRDMAGEAAQHSPDASLKAPSPKYTVSISFRKSSWVCGSFGNQWQSLLQALDPQEITGGISCSRALAPKWVKRSSPQ